MHRFAFTVDTWPLKPSYAFKLLFKKKEKNVMLNVCHVSCSWRDEWAKMYMLPTFNSKQISLVCFNIDKSFC